MIASLSIPGGEAKRDEDRVGYHLVWTRDMVNSAIGLLASGNDELPVWTFRRRARSVRPGTLPRVQAGAPFRLRWTSDDWWHAKDIDSTPTGLGISFVDIPVARHQAAPLRFTFFWPEAGRWEGRDFAVDVVAP
jgi:hypothetical protein